MSEQLFLKQYSQLPESLKKELLEFFEFLLFKHQNQQSGKQKKQNGKKSKNGTGTASGETAVPNDKSLPEKRKAPKAGFLKGTFVMSPDFDEPLEDFKEYME